MHSRSHKLSEGGEHTLMFMRKFTHTQFKDRCQLCPDIPRDCEARGVGKLLHRSYDYAGGPGGQPAVRGDDEGKQGHSKAE